MRQLAKQTVNRFLPVGSRRRGLVKKIVKNKSIPISNQPIEDISYVDWINTKEQAFLKRTKQSQPLKIKPLISIVVPCYNTPDKYLNPMFDSVVTQTYDNWQLIVVDGSSDEARSLAIRNASQRDKRITYLRVKKNLGIAGNTNEGIKAASGDFLGFLDHDDTLAPWALEQVCIYINKNPKADIFYSDEDYLSEDGKERLLPFFKPDWNFDLFTAVNYLAHFVVIRAELAKKNGGLRMGYDGAQDYDFLLNRISKTVQIIHIPVILYHWRMAEGSTAKAIGEKNYADDAGQRALADFVKRNKIKASVIGLPDQPTTYRLKYELPKALKVSIIIPFKDKPELLKKCVNSILKLTQYKNYEILLVSNNSQQKTTQDLLRNLEPNPKIRILNYDHSFNYSAINNFGRRHAAGEVLIFLNNDTEVINEGWLEELASVAIRKETGAVGPLLFYPDNAIQHAGVVVGMVGAAGHVFRGQRLEDLTYFRSPQWPRNYLAVTGACLAIETKKFDEIGGFNENIVVAGSDVVLCLELYKKGYKNVYWPYARLKHYESQSVGSYQNAPPSDYDISIEHYRPYLNYKDPYFNPNLELMSEQIRLRNKYD